MAWYEIKFVHTFDNVIFREKENLDKYPQYSHQDPCCGNKELLRPQTVH